MHITASVATLLVLAHEKHLPEPVAMSARKGKDSFTIDFGSMSAMNAWAEALEFGESAVNTYTYADGSVVYSRWQGWNGWHLRLRYEEDAPSVGEVGEALLSSLEVMSQRRTAVMLP